MEKSFDSEKINSIFSLVSSAKNDLRIDALNAAMANLVKNAMEVNRNHEPIQITCGREENRWYFTIEDNGPGIAPEHLDKLFTPFFTTKAKGTGLGLVISKLIVEKLGGYIKVASTPGRGSRFAVYLPKGENAT